MCLGCPYHFSRLRSTQPTMLWCVFSKIDSYGVSVDSPLLPLVRLEPYFWFLKFPFKPFQKYLGVGKAFEDLSHQNGFR